MHGWAQLAMLKCAYTNTKKAVGNTHARHAGREGRYYVSSVMSQDEVKLAEERRARVGAEQAGRASSRAAFNPSSELTGFEGVTYTDITVRRTKETQIIFLSVR